MRSIRSPYTPLSTTSTERSRGTTEVSAASTAAVPEPVKSTAPNVRSMPSRETRRSRTCRMTSKNSGSR